jgi:uncharacterized membrane protein YfcA
MTLIDPLTLAALVAAIGLAGIVNGAIGFGFALLAVNALALVVDARNAVIVMSILAPIVSGFQLWHHRNRRGLAARLRVLIAAGVAGTLIGTQLLVLLAPAVISLVLGVFTLWFVLDSLRTERPPLAGTTQRWLAPVAGLVGGTTNGAIGASGPVFGTYLTAIGLRGADFAFSISLAFFTMAIARIGLLGALGQYTQVLLFVGFGLAVPAILAQQVGLWYRGRLPDRTVYRAVLVVLAVAGTNLVWRAVTALATG